MRSLEILNPSGVIIDQDVQAGSRGLGSLAGVRIGYLDNSKPGANHVLRLVREDAAERFGASAVNWTKTGNAGSAGPADYDAILASGVPAVITALGD